MTATCGAERRRRALRSHPALNGIDYVEVEAATATLSLHFVNPIPKGTLLPQDVTISGGERIRDLNVVDLDPADSTDPAHAWTVTLNKRGDLSTYTLAISAPDAQDAPRFDPLLSRVDFSFAVGCDGSADCLSMTPCPPEEFGEPELDYQAKDYSSFRRLLLDRMALLTPDWSERNPADLGVALVELLAYVGDYLSYEQDAVATEAYLGTARRRVSVRRHARLVNYAVFDGRNARAWVQVRVDCDVVGSDAAPALPRRTVFLTHSPGKPPRLAPDSRDLQDALVSGADVFESMTATTSLYAAHNRLRFYTWGGERCCLAQGATSATLREDHCATLRTGQVLVFVEERGARTGEQSDADPAHRHAVRLTKVARGEDPLGDLQTDAAAQGSASGKPFAVTEIAWDAADALPFPLCLATIGDDGTTVVEDVTVALGNIVLVDHGRTVNGPDGEDLGRVPFPSLSRLPAPGTSGAAVPIPARYAPRLKERPMTQVGQVTVRTTENGRTTTRLVPFEEGGPAADTLTPSGRVTLPSLRLVETGTTLQEWFVRRDLLASGPLAREFVAEVEEDGTVAIRFGDDRVGKRPDGGAAFRAHYRVGNGAAGNVGIAAIAHVVSAEPALDGVSNPLPAAGGEDPERSEDVRQHAPAAYRQPERAVTADDYAAVAQRHPEVQRAAATVRWTGSWRTVFLTIDRRGGKEVDEAFAAELRDFLERFRLAGHDLAIRAPRFVPLQIVLHVWTTPGARQRDVGQTLTDLFSNRILPDGRRGLFHPDNLTFGQPVYLSVLTAAALAVPGVAAVNFAAFRRREDAAGDAQETDALTMDRLQLARLEVARLDNDPNFPERGTFTIRWQGER